jgi:hypothetical protein
MLKKVTLTIGSKNSNANRTVDLAIKQRPIKIDKNNSESIDIDIDTLKLSRSIKKSFEFKSVECANMINTFNSVLIKMIDHLTQYYGDSNMSFLKMFMQNMIRDAPDETISYFLLHVYKNDRYRKNILNQNDAFFLNEIDTVSEDGSADSDTITKLFEFKDKWDKFDKDTKKFIKKTFLVLVMICSKYVFLL